MGRAGFNPPLLWTLEPMLDVSGEASLGGPVAAGADAAAAAVEDDDKLSGSVFRPGERENRDFSVPPSC